MPNLPGYRGRSLKLLGASGVDVGDRVRVELDEGKLEGVLMPRYELADDWHVVLKLDNGYNVGASVEKIRRVVRLKIASRPGFKRPRPMKGKGLPRVSIIGTGGTIASRIDYRTGGVYPVFTPEELYGFIPELSSYASIETDPLFNIFSENVRAEHWEKLSVRVEEKVRKRFKGVVITHGTDAMGYTAAALSFSLQGIPIPVVLVGAQRSSDRPSSDAATNLLGAVKFAGEADASGVYVAMHAGMGDGLIAIHKGTKVRKNHTSRRDAFESVNVTPVAYIRDGKIVLLGEVREKRSGEFRVRPRFERKVSLIKFHPGFDPSIIDFLVNSGFKGIVLEGTGLGHVGKYVHESVKRAVDNGLLVSMTSQCIWGRVGMMVYETGRDLLTIGVIPLGDMLPETALVKMMWVLANSKGLEEAKALMLSNLAGEYSPISPLRRRA